MPQKLLSGRFLLTLAAGVVFVYASVTKTLPPAAIAAIIMGVFKDYFSKRRKDEQDK